MKMTFKEEVVQQLLQWLEGNIQTPLTIDDFVTKSGYSKWHLQRIFKEVTGQKLATYARQRRLTSTAFMLRLFDKQIDTVGSEHGFSSHNVFHKTFKRHFNVTPAQYRDAVDWSCAGLCPPVNLTAQAVPTGQLVELEALSLSGQLNHFPFTLHTIDDFCWQKRQQFWQSRLAALAAPPEDLYGLINVVRGKAGEEHSTLQYLTCLTATAVSAEVEQIDVTLERQTYLQFSYCGESQHYAEFIGLIYEHALPLARAVRRDGHDIERINQRWFEQHQGRQLKIDYFVPVMI
ncbi:helix-turn-helix domain-containing protein [Erwinia sp. E602]|nr:helix-turn-helix domain-containing protein [Erwinia sp. E602]